MNNQTQIASFLSLAQLFEENGFSLYLVGGSVRDYLLDLPLVDMDVVSEATPSDMKKFLIDANYRYEAFGSVKLKYHGLSFDITTMRKEEGYIDYRHPKQITFVKSLKEDVTRRDFTINALYLDKDLNVIDYVKGQKDLNYKIIKMIGDPETRIKEDPLRIVRAVRFHFDLDFEIDINLLEAMKNNIALLDNLTPEKVTQDIKKSKNDKLIIDYLSQLRKM